MPAIDTYVCVDDTHIYPARVDPANRWNGWVSPGFTLDTVRQLAAHTAQMAQEYGHNAVDEIRVIDGAPEPVVQHIRWPYLASDSPATATTVITPDAEGLYWIGGGEWTWYIVEDGPLYCTKRAAFEAWKRVLDHSTCRVGEILRTQMPDATSALIDLTGAGHIVQVDAASGTWPSDTGADGKDGYGPFDAETLGEADGVLHRALDHGRDPVHLRLAGWKRAPEIGHPELYRLVFPARAESPAGDAPLDEARAEATAARRQLLTDSVPYLAKEARAVYPGAIGVLADPGAEQPFLAFLVETGDVPTASHTVPAHVAAKVRDRLAEMFAFRPTREDLAACGDVTPQPDGTYLIPFPAQ